jgi:uncharacterized membrane protein YdbT with pleckstrin-like domain
MMKDSATLAKAIRSAVAAKQYGQEVCVCVYVCMCVCVCVFVLVIVSWKACPKN